MEAKFIQNDTYRQQYKKLKKKSIHKTSTSEGWDFKNWVNQLKASSVLKRSVFLMYAIVFFRINELEI